MRSENWTRKLLRPKNRCVLNHNGLESPCGNDSPFKTIIQGKTLATDPVALDGIFRLRSLDGLNLLMDRIICKAYRDTLLP